ncbi:MAG TPA: efflux RND transporter periplasmic adaptor subunit, partial [Planctomycetota bacterium]
LTGCTRGAEGATEAGESSAAQTSDAAATKAKPKDPILVRAEPVRVGPIERRIQVTATLVSLDEVDVVAERAEPIVELLVEEGDRVERGQLLARLRTEVADLDVAEMTVRLEEALQAMTQTRLDLERNQRLFKEGGTNLLSQRELEASEQAMVAAHTGHQAAGVALDRAKMEAARCRILAPIDGTVTVREASVGDRCTIGMRLFQIVDLSKPRAVFHRPQREIASLQVGQVLSARSEALPGVEILGRVERIAPTVDAQTGTVKVTAVLEPGERTFPTGILVELDLVLDRHERALLIPKRALLYQGQRSHCFVVRDGRAVRLEVIPGFENSERLEALPAENGPLPEDQVVIVGADRLADGDPVVIAQEG